MKPIQTGVIAILAAAALAAGCAPAEPAEPGSTPNVTLTYTTFMAVGGHEEDLNTIIKAFEADNPGVTVDAKFNPYTDYFTALQTDIASGTVTDVFDIEHANFRAYAENNVAAPLTGIETDVFKQGILEAYQFNGTQYALPASFSTVVLFYNKDLFDQAGVSYPTNDWTWDDEMSAAEAMTDKVNDTWGDYQPVTYNEYYKTVQQAGGSFLSDDASQVTFDSPEGISGAKFLVDKVGTVQPGAGDTSTDSDLDLFASGRLAMWHNGIWQFAGLQEAPFDWDIVVEPGLTRQASAMFSNAVMVSATSKNIELATKLAQFMTSSKTAVDVRLAADWELPPIADSSLLTAYFDRGKPANRQAVFDSLDAVALAPSIGDGQAEMSDTVTNFLSEAAAGRLTAEQAVTQAAEAVRPVLPKK
ncbi:MAG: sugar ABC transporter substrate-binding protein [Bifidobacteriaceae bacterium]|nr:sugar ABC transporter substrate-binding protein [Bifidobacteriaceae bacterium]